MQKVSGLRLKLFFHPLPQYLVARKLGINKCVLSGYSLGRRPISAKHLMSLANYFDCGPDELLQFVETDAFDELVEA